jgi:hypothetical protein
VLLRFACRNLGKSFVKFRASSHAIFECVRLYKIIVSHCKSLSDNRGIPLRYHSLRNYPFCIPGIANRAMVHYQKWNDINQSIKNRLFNIRCTLIEHQKMDLSKPKTNFNSCFGITGRYNECCTYLQKIFDF